MDQNYKPENHLLPIELHHADFSLEKGIKKILHNRQSGKKKKKSKLLRALQDQSYRAHLRSHVQYYLDSLQPNPAKILLDLCSIATILAFAAYAAIRLVNVII